MDVNNFLNQGLFLVGVNLGEQDTAGHLHLLGSYELLLLLLTHPFKRILSVLVELSLVILEFESNILLLLCLVHAVVVYAVHAGILVVVLEFFKLEGLEITLVA